MANCLLFISCYYGCTLLSNMHGISWTHNSVLVSMANGSSFEIIVICWGCVCTMRALCAVIVQGLSLLCTYAMPHCSKNVPLMLKNVLNWSSYWADFCRACKQSIRLVRLIGRADGIDELAVLGKSQDSVGCSLSVDSLTETWLVLLLAISWTKTVSQPNMHINPMRWDKSLRDIVHSIFHSTVLSHFPIQ